jgi:uncharacterized protein GlcG (DUF336 family)
MDTVTSKKLTREGAMKVVNAAVDRAHALGAHVSISVVDRPGQSQERGADEIPFRQEKPQRQ